MGLDEPSQTPGLGHIRPSMKRIEDIADKRVYPPEPPSLGSFEKVKKLGEWIDSP